VSLEGQKVLIAGATGFVGSHVSRLLVERGFEVTVLTSGTTTSDRLSSIENKLAWISIPAFPSLAAALASIQNVDAFINCAVSYGRLGESLSTLVETNVVQPLRIVEALASKGLQIFINADTFYPATRDSYASSKGQLRDWLPSVAQSAGVAIANLKLQHVYGPQDGQRKFVPHIIQVCTSGEKSIELTIGAQTRDFVYVEDVAQAFLAALTGTAITKGSCFEIDVGTGTSITLREVVELIKQKTGSATELKFGAVEYAPNEIMHSVADVSAAKRIGWSSRTSLEEGLKATVAWYNRGERA